MKKKLLSLALVFVMALTLLPTAAFAEENDPNPSDPAGLVQQSQPNEPTNTENTTPKVTSDPNANTVACTGAEDCPADTHNPGCPKASKTDNSGGTNTNDVVCTGKEDCTAKSHSADCVSQCTVSDSCPNTQGKAGAHKAKCPKLTPAQPVTPTCNHVETGGTLVAQNTAKAATCVSDGEKAYYQCSVCHSYFIAGDSTAYTAVSVAALRIPATPNTHKRPTNPVFTAADANESLHYYTCDDCHQRVSESHSFSGNTCTVCGYTRTGSPSPSPSGYVDISNAYVNSYSISVTWYSDMPSGTSFDIYVDGNYRTTVAPSRSSSGYFSYTEDFSHYLGDSYYTVAVYLHDNTSYYDSIRVYNRYYDHDYDYWYDHRYPNSTPGTNSSGIPYASQVNGRYSASEAIRILRNCNHNNLQYDLLNSTSASNSFSDLEDAVKRANNVFVQVNIDRGDVPSAIRNIRIDGAAFNASSTNSTVRLEVGAPSRNRYSGYGYQFSMSLTGVGGDSSLDVPVKITMPVPSNINSNTVRILHYHDSNSPTVIEPKVSGSFMSFTLTGFSDFVVTDSRTDPYYYYYTPGSNVSRRDIMAEHLAVVLPILASMPSSGYVYDDVPPTYWAVNEIAWARDGGMMAGYYDGTFRPYAATTRQELWMVLGRLAGANPADMWAARQWVMSAGISDGQNPHSPLSRQQMIAMLYRYAQYLGVDVSAQASLRGYGDSALISGYARNAMAWAIDQGILLADGNNCLRPQDIATRADFAVYLYRFIH